jgi:hypothetical protein
VRGGLERDDDGGTGGLGVGAEHPVEADVALLDVDLDHDVAAVELVDLAAEEVSGAGPGGVEAGGDAGAGGSRPGAVAEGTDGVLHDATALSRARAVGK